METAPGARMPRVDAGGRRDHASRSIELPAITAPRGGGAIRGIDEKFTVNAASGTASFSIPLPLSPGRSGFEPRLALSYDSGAAAGAFGVGFGLSIAAITRKTDRGVPRYLDGEDSDTFVLGGAEDLVPLLEPDGAAWKRVVLGRTLPDGSRWRVHRYRPRTEGGFARIERWVREDT